MKELRSFVSLKGKPLPANHHLWRHPRGLFYLKVTVAENRKLVGERLLIPLGTRDEGMARERRDEKMDDLRKQGVLARKIVPTDSRAVPNLHTSG